MNINGAFPSDYLQASDLQGRPVTVTMGRVEMGKVGDDHKPILHFQGTDKTLVLNKTNANSIATVYGDETDNWFGQQIEVYPSETDFQGRRVPCIRIRGPQRQMAQPQQQNGMGQASTPFDGPGDYQAPQGHGVQQAPQTQATNLDDEIPF